MNRRRLVLAKFLLLAAGAILARLVHLYLREAAISASLFAL